jgi:hypothetical protein
MVGRHAMSLAERLGAATVLLVVGAGTLRAQDSVVVSTAIEHVVTAGYWKVDDRDGVYRAIVVNSGWEHVTSRLIVQWLESEPDSQDVVVRTSLPVPTIPTNQWSLGVPHMIHRADTWYLRISGTNAYTLAQRHWVIRLGSPGQMTTCRDTTTSSAC